MFTVENWQNSILIQDVEHENRFYLCIGKRRYIYEDGKCVGWYKP